MTIFNIMAHKFNNTWHVIDKETGKCRPANKLEIQWLETETKQVLDIMRETLGELIRSSYKMSGIMPYVRGSQQWTDRDKQELA